MFVVVCTLEDDEERYLAVSTTFIVDGVLFYPKNKKDVYKSITERKVPDLVNWYPITEFSIVSKRMGEQYNVFSVVILFLFSILFS